MHIATTDVIRMDSHLTKLWSLLRSFNRLPVQTCITDKGATPVNVPITNGLRGRLIKGEHKLIVQLGNIGVALKKNTHRNRFELYSLILSCTNELNCSILLPLPRLKNLSSVFFLL